MSKKSFNLPLFFHERGFYYGWVVLVAGTLGVIMSVPGQTMGVSVYTDHLIESLGVSRVNLSMVYMFGTLSSAFLLPFAGRLLDKIGARIIGVVATTGLALSLSLLALSPDIVLFIEKFLSVKSDILPLIIAFFCFLGIRHFGQGQLTMASRTMMGRWFEKRRGLVLGISGTFVAFAFGVAPLVLNNLINAFEWQSSLFVLAGASLVMAIFAFLTFRKSPEHYGLVVDGVSASEEEAKESSKLDLENSFTASEAKKTLTFWTFNFGMVAQAMLVTAITFNMADIGEVNGITATKAFSVFLYVSVISVISELVGGFLSDKIPLRYLLMTMQLGLALALIGLQSYGNDLGFYTTALGFGISGGLFSLLTGAAWPKLFGRLHLGAIVGVATSWMVAGSALGPYLFSLGKSLTGSYKLSLFLSLVVPLTVFVMAFWSTNPRKELLKK